MTALANFILRNPGRVLVFGLILTLVAAGVGRDLDLQASKLDFLPQNDPAVIEYENFIDAFGAVNAVLVILEGPADHMRGFADEASQAISGLTGWVRSVTYKLDVDRYEAQGLVLQSPDELSETSTDLMEVGPLVRTLGKDPTMASFLTFVADEMGDEDAVAPAISNLIDNVTFVHTAVQGLVRLLQYPGDKDVVLFPKLQISDEDLKRMHVDKQGYLVSPDGRYLLMVVNPARLMDKDYITEAFLADFEKSVSPLKSKYPDVKVGMAGGSIRDLEEEDTVDADLIRTSVTAGIGIFLISLLAFGGLFPAMLILVILVVIVIFTAAATQLLVGHLNLISAVFVAILFGLGHDFGNYVIILAEEWLPTRGLMAYRDAIVTAGSSLLTAALTTAVAFYSLILHDFKAFRELGVIAGTGILIAYVAMITLLPAALILRARFSGELETVDSMSIATRQLPISRLLVFFQEFRGTILLVFLAGIGLSLPLYDKTPFEYDLHNLLPDGGHSVEFEQILKKSFSISSDFNVITSRKLEDVYEVAHVLEGAKSVQTIDSLAYLIPKEMEEKRHLLDKIKLWAQWIGVVTHDSPPSDLESLLEALADVQRALKNPSRLANMENSEPLREAIARLEDEIARATEILRTARDPVPGISQSEVLIVKEIESIRDFMWKAATVEPYTLETLPDEMKRKFIGKSGEFVTYITPSLDLSAEGNARQFYEETKAADVGVTGIPVVVFRIMNQIKMGWLNAAVWALLGICIMILIDFQSLSIAAFSIIPLFCGAAFMAGSLCVVGIKWNVLNSVSLPILIGVGIDYGVNLLHRFMLERDLSVAVGSTGRAIFYSAATSCMGFGSLLMAKHRGLASFGTTMFFGVLFSMLAALLFLPAVIAAFGLDLSGLGGTSMESEGD